MTATATDQTFVPQTDPRAGVEESRQEIDVAVSRVLDSGRYILGAEVAAFEEEFARYVGVPHAVGVASGTDAIHLALRACGVSVGDAVVTVAHTAVATVTGIEACGAEPILVDIHPTRQTLDPDRLEALLVGFDRSSLARLRSIKAIVPVHLYGLMADMPAILAVAARYEIAVVEDCAQAHGAVMAGRMAGSWGQNAAFSFYPTKNLAAVGDGGIVTTWSDDVAERLRKFRQYGWRERYTSETWGTNSRLDELQAAILRVRLPSLDDDNHRRRRIANEYRHGLGSAKIQLPDGAQGDDHVLHQYVVRSTRREDLRSHLHARGVGTLVHYPVPVHLQPAFAGRLAAPGSLPQTEAAAREVVSLPMFPQMTDGQIRSVVSGVLSWDPEPSVRGAHSQ